MMDEWVLANKFIFFTNPANAAGLHLTIRCRQPLHGALIFPLQKRFLDAVVDKIPGKALIRAALPVDIEIRVYGDSF